MRNQIIDKEDLTGKAKEEMELTKDQVYVKIAMRTSEIFVFFLCKAKVEVLQLLLPFIVADFSCCSLDCTRALLICPKKKRKRKIQKTFASIIL